MCKKKYIRLTVSIVLLLCCSCQNDSIEQEKLRKELQEFMENYHRSNSDSIPYIIIGNRGWSTKNLDVITFRNGDTIPEVKSSREWLNACYAHKPAWCYFQNDTSLGKCFGKLYNWYAVNDPRYLAPKGWRIPSWQDCVELENYFGGGLVAIQKMRSELLWLKKQPNDTISADSCGFNALPGGYRQKFGKFDDLGYAAHWWTKSFTFDDGGLSFRMDSQFLGVNNWNRGNGCYVRIIKDIPRMIQF
jgi:uncharacterized protein (TIGR02145 family)